MWLWLLITELEREEEVLDGIVSIDGFGLETDVELKGAGHEVFDVLLGNVSGE